MPPTKPHDLFSGRRSTVRLGKNIRYEVGITIYVNGTPMNPVQIDTSTTATDAIAYVATDQSGLTSTTTRTVIVQAADAPPIVPAPAASTTATTATSSVQ
jgi:hypothetical protein